MAIGAREAAVYQSIAPEYMENWKPLNTIQAEALFMESACLMWNRDGVPKAAACKLFGWRAVAKVDEEARRETLAKSGPGRMYMSAVCFDDFCMDYLTRSGFMRAVSICNLRAHVAQERPLWAARDADIDERS